jgi:hypothetical protein
MKKLILSFLVILSLASTATAQIRANMLANKGVIVPSDSIYRRNYFVLPLYALNDSTVGIYLAADSVLKYFKTGSGTYTPTLTNVTNVASSTAYACQWSRSGNVVTVSGKVDIDVNAAGLTELGMSLPIASAMTTQQQLGGAAASSAAASLSAAVRADFTTDRAAFVFTATSITNNSYFFSFTYLVQ